MRTAGLSWSPGPSWARCSVALVLFASVILTPVEMHAADAGTAKDVYGARCAVCHGADRGGYIGPALNREALKRFTEGQLVAKIKTGGVGTLMPRHARFFEILSEAQMAALAHLIKTNPNEEVFWGLADIAASLTVHVADENALPANPVYDIDDMDDLMAVMARGRFAAGDAAKAVFFDGRTNTKVGEVPTRFAPHILDYHPIDERWAYLTTDAGYVYKIDLYSLQAVRSVRVGLNGVSLAISRDGRYIAAGSYIPNTAVILDAVTLAPLKQFQLRGTDPDGREVESDSGVILGTPYADVFVMALEQSGQVWSVDLSRRGFPVTKIENVGRHLHDAFLSPSGRYMAISSYDDNTITAIDLRDMQIVRKMPAGRQPHVGSGAIIQRDGRTLGIGTNIGTPPSGENFVTVFDMDTFEVVKQIPVLGPTESPAAHPKAPYIAVDIVGAAGAAKIQFIDKKTLDVVKTVSVGGHSHFPEYTARGDYLYVSAGYEGDGVVIYRADTLEKVDSFPVEVPAGIFSHVRARTVAVGLEPTR